MNQLTDIRNKSAESLKTNWKKKKKLSDYVVCIGAFLYQRHVHSCGDGESAPAFGNFIFAADTDWESTSLLINN